MCEVVQDPAEYGGAWCAKLCPKVAGDDLPVGAVIPLALVVWESDSRHVAELETVIVDEEGKVTPPRGAESLT